jgi:hypothetical protein
MPDPNDAPYVEDQDQEDAADLPDRRAMSLLDPGSLLGGAGGGGLLGGTPAGGTTAAPTTPSAPPSPIALPNVPVPAQNPGGTYTPEATSNA